jgi:glutamate dehydrogenase
MSSDSQSNIQSLREVELLDADYQPSLSTQPATGHVLPQSLSSPTSQVDLAQTLYSELKDGLQASLPWFLNQMPPLYHAVTPWKEKMEHVVEIVAGKVLSDRQIVERINKATNIATLLVPAEDDSAPLALAPKLSAFDAKFVFLFQSLDSKVGVCSLHLGSHSKIGKWENAELQKKKPLVLGHISNAPAAKVESYLNSLDSDFVTLATPRMIAIGYETFEYCQMNESAYLNLTTIDGESKFRVDIGLKGFPLTRAIENLLGVFTRYNFSVRRILGHEVRMDGTQPVTVLSVVASPSNGEKFTPDMQPWKRVEKGLKTLSYVDHGDEFSILLQGKNPRSLNETNLVRSMANWAHIFLTKVNPYYFSLDRVSKILLRNEAFIENAIRYFRSRFDPRFQEDRISASTEISRQIDSMLVETTDEVDRNILREAFHFLKNILKTNYFLVSKGALSFRVDPSVLNKAYYPETPFGIFYMCGRDVRGFQVRYRDIARGGVRVVMPRTSADYDNALAGLFDEVNGLSSAQQLKNKDIPEGGSKCVLVVRPGGDRHHAVKSAVSGLLDLITIDAKTGKLADGVIDYFGQEEIIYLGPDENLTDDLIVWTIEHALRRGYKYAYAFMSSKPDFGINHKTYGVTSEGLNVYLDNVLRYLKLNTPQTSFRVKMTGGPDGDVAGNELKILHREYGQRAKVVAIGDGYGAAYDPNGLDWTELLRLVIESKSIVEFNRTLLSKDPSAFVIRADTKENIKIRDNLYANVEAEIFIPAGGRPYTVKESNWSRFLLSDGRPSSLAIVEGANIFFTPEARKKIVESGVVVIKDSSANKAGVICSSYEIIACLTISPEEFAKIKNVYVGQVIDILKFKADQEAKLLFAEWKKRSHETNLVDLSYEVSAEINYAKDIVREMLNRLSDTELESENFHSVLFMHCPQILVEKYKDRIVNRLPRAHKIAIISAYMASHLIYREGLNWLDTMEPDQVYRIALEYMKAEQKVERMILDLTAANVADKELIISVLRGAGAKHLASSRA